MTDTARLQLFYSPSAQMPARFLEIRTCGGQVWHAEGGVHTWGKAEYIDCGTDEEARKLAAVLAHDKLDESFELARDVTYSPDAFDYEAFESEVTRGLKLFWSAVRARFPSAALDRLALVTDSDVMTIGGSAHAASSGDSDETLYIPSEWKHQEMAELDIAYRMVLSKHREIPFEAWPAHHADNMLACMIRSLETLRGKGLFDAGTLLQVCILDDDQIAGMHARLNTQENVEKLEGFWGPSTKQIDATI